MTRAEVRRLYVEKTWMWSNGGGYLDTAGRFYAAVGQDPATGSYLRGSWLTNRKGEMCFAGVWTTAGKRAFGRTCFAHRISGDTIYQKKLPSGSWYAFKNSPVQSDDEFSKIVEGDRVSEQLKQLQAVSTP